MWMLDTTVCQVSQGTRQWLRHTAADAQQWWKGSRDCHGYAKPTGKCNRLAWGTGMGWVYSTLAKPVPTATSGKGHLALAVFRCFSCSRASWDILGCLGMSQDALGLLKHLKTARARWPFPDEVALWIGRCLGCHASHYVLILPYRALYSLY